MGEYNRINSRIRDLLKRKADVKAELNACSEEKSELLIEELAELTQAIGECEGALLEMAEIDGLDDPNEAFDFFAEPSVEENYLSDTCYRGFDLTEVLAEGKIVTVLIRYDDPNDIFTETSFCIADAQELAELWETYCTENGIDPDSITAIERKYDQADADEYGESYYMN